MLAATAACSSAGEGGDGAARRMSKSGGGGAGKLLSPAEAKASKAEARVRRWHSPVVARLSSAPHVLDQLVHFDCHAWRC
jgi:hypothetical protein